jgi:phosphate transport system substrate-binding protein
MKYMLLTIALVAGLSLPVCAETIKIAGSGQMLPLATELGQAYSKKYPGDVVLVNPKSLGQRGGVQAVADGSIDIATSARRLDDEEKRLPVTAYEVASVAGIFAVNPSVTVKGLTSKQICGIYSGRITNWKQVGGQDAPIVVLTRPETDSTKIVMRRRLHCFAKVKESARVIVKEKSRDMVVCLMNTPNAIGMTDVINLTNSGGRMLALKLDGKDITSSVSGPIQHYYNFVLSNKPRAVDLRFMEFLRSPEGQAVIRQQKANPIMFELPGAVQ